MARVASCPQCNHELLVPSEANSESWAKCPECRAFFQVKQATSRELLTAMLVEAGEPQTIDLDPQDVASPTMTAQDDLETAVAPQPWLDNEIAATRDDDLDNASELPAAARDEFQTTLIEQDSIDHGIAGSQDEDREWDNPKKGDDLEAAAQRIDEWFRSAKTVPDAPPIGEDGESPSVEEISDDLATSGPPRTNATLDMDASDTNDLAAMADFDLDEPDDRSPKKAIAEKPAWDDTAQMDDLLDDGPPADEFAAEFADADEADAFNPDFAHDGSSTDAEPPSGEERPAINLFADGDSREADSSKRRGQRRERSFARSLILIVVAGLFGSTAGYYALLWLRGPNIDFLNVAQYLPKAILPASFDDAKQIVRNEPPANAAETMADVESTTPDGTTAPQELPPETDVTAEPMPDATVPTDAAPADTVDQSTEVQASFSETGSAADAAAPASAVGDRYSTTANETETGTADVSTATGVTTEKPATSDLTVDDLVPTEAPATDATADPSATTEPSLPTTSEPAAAGVTDAGSEPASLDDTSADPLLGNSETKDVSAALEVRIANAPTFTADDLRASMDSATKAQPQLVDGNFADSKAVAQAKGRSYAVLADLAQKSIFADASQQSATPMIEQADVLFRKTLADAHTRGEVAQILPRWVQSPNRKHGGVFFAGKVVSHVNAGSVVECTVELDGGQTLTVLAPANAVEQLDPAKPLAIVGWIVDAPKSQVNGYAGATKSPAIWTKKLIPLE